MRTLVLSILFSSLCYSQTSFNCTFENNYYIGSNAFKQTAPSVLDFPPPGTEHRWILDNTISRSGSSSLRFELRPGDISGNGEERAELRGFVDQNGNSILEDKINITQFYGFSIFIPTDWVPPVESSDGDSHCTIMQLHQIALNNEGGRPPLSIQCLDRFFIKIGGREINDKKNVSVSYEFTNGSLNKGKWTDFIIQIKFSINKQGLVKIWRRNEGWRKFVLVFEKNNVSNLIWDKNVSTKKPLRHTWHMGIYRNPQEKIINVLWLDNITRSNKKADITSANLETLIDDKEPAYRSNIQLGIANYPNPFNGGTRIIINTTDAVLVKIYNLLGQIIYQANVADFVFNSSTLPSGVYLVRAETKSQTFAHKIILLK